MAACDLLDWGCIIQNEIIGSAILTVVFLAILYFITTSKLDLGWEATSVFGMVFLLFVGIMFYGFTIIYAFATIIVAIGLGWAVQRIWGNR